MNLSRLARICAPVIFAVGILAAALPAGAADVVDYWVGTLGVCTVQTAGVNDPPSGQTQVYVYNSNSCGVTTCIRESYTSGGSAFWGSEACTSGVAGQYGIPPAVVGSYLGRQIRVGSSCWWDTLFTNPASHACV